MARRYSPEVKARAAADLVAGMTVREVAAKYEMSQTSVADLSRTSKRGAVYVRKIANINELQEHFLNQLSHDFAALQALTDHIRFETKHAVEHGDKLGVLFGVVFDKTGKIAGAAMAGAGLDRQRLGDVPADGDDQPAADVAGASDPAG